MIWNAPTILLGASLAVCGALVGGYTAGHRAGSNAEKASHLEASRIAQVAMDARMEQVRKEAEAARQVTQALRDKIEVQHDKATKTIIATRLENERLATELGGLRDPGNQADRDALPTDTNPPGCDCPTPAPGRLSAEASRFLLGLAYEADQAAQYARDCHEWAVTIPNLNKKERSGRNVDTEQTKE